MLISTLILAFPIAMIVAGLTDLFTFKIPNKVTIVLSVTFFLWALALGMPLERLGLHVAVGAGVLVIGFLLFAGKIIGGGDAKLLAAASLWIGPADLAAFIFLTGLAGGLLTLVLLGYRSIVPPPFIARHDWAMRLHNKNEGLPYGVAIAIAALWLFPTAIWTQGVMA